MSKTYNTDSDTHGVSNNHALCKLVKQANRAIVREGKLTNQRLESVICGQIYQIKIELLNRKCKVDHKAP